MKKNVSLITLLLLIFLAASTTCAASNKANVRRVIGDVNRYNVKKNTWSNLRIGQHILEHDSVTTALESDVVMSLPEGSMVTIRENSKIVLNEFSEENGDYKTNFTIVSGKLDFSVQKQNGNSSFRFTTGTMAIAIRGTEGCIASGETFLAGLRNGLLQVDKTTIQTVFIRGGQIVFDRDSLIVMDVASAGEPDFHDAVLNILADKSIPIDDVKKLILQEDSLYTRSVQEARKQVNCTIDALPDTISNQEIQIHGSCNAGTTASFFGEPILLESNGNFFASITLDSIATGEKKMRLDCSALSKNFGCADAKTFYKPSAQKIQSQVIVSSRIPATVCNEGLNIEGSYQTLDSTAKLTISVGNSYTSSNLMKAADGKAHSFAHNISITDRNSLWNAKFAKIELDAEGKTITREIPLQISKTCQAVNQQAPLIKLISYDSLKCDALVSINNIQDDISIFRTSIDNMVGKSNIIEKNTSTKIKLHPGIHNYEFTAKDQAENETSVTKTLGCFPNKFFTVQIKGNNNKEVIWIPPDTPNLNNHSEYGTRFIKRTLRFKIDLPTISEIHDVTVKQNGIKILHETTTQIESLDYDVPVELLRGKTSKIEIVVTHKSGRKASATKIYEVK